MHAFSCWLYRVESTRLYEGDFLCISFTRNFHRGFIIVAALINILAFCHSLKFHSNRIFIVTFLALIYIRCFYVFAPFANVHHQPVGPIIEQCSQHLNTTRRSKMVASLVCFGVITFNDSIKFYGFQDGLLFFTNSFFSCSFFPEKFRKRAEILQKKKQQKHRKTRETHSSCLLHAMQT